MSRTPYHVTLSKKTKGPRRLQMLGALFVAGTPQRLMLTEDQVRELEAGDFTLRPAAAEPDAKPGPLASKPVRPKPAPVPPTPEPSTTDEAPAADLAATKGE